MTTVKIYVIGFDTVSAPDSDIFVPFQAGKAGSLYDLGVQGDDTGDNISDLNSRYAEMTAMYWAWKNQKPSDYIGFFHYRRFLDLTGAPAVSNSDFHFSNFSNLSKRRYGWTDEAIAAAVSSADIIAPPLDKIQNPQDGHKSTCSIYEQYVCYHIARDFDIMIDEAKKCTDPTLLDEALNSHKAAFNHIFLMRWDLFDEYMKWSFGILEAVRSKIALDEPIYGKGQVQSRAIGYLGERLFNVFVHVKRKEGIRVRHASRVFGHAPSVGKRRLRWARAIGRVRESLFKYKPLRRGFYLKAFGISLLTYRPY